MTADRDVIIMGAARGPERAFIHRLPARSVVDEGKPRSAFACSAMDW